MKKAVLINPHAQSVEDIEIDEGIQPFYDVMGCQMIQSAPLSLPLEGNDNSSVTLFVDEEGMYAPVRFFFRIEQFSPAPLCGKAVIVGHDGQGGSCDSPVNAEQVLSNIEWLGRG